MNWTRHSTIGRGSTATVSLATSAISGELFAAKSAELSLSNPLQKEQSILSKLNSPYIVQYKGFDITKENTQLYHYNLFMEYFPRGTLFDEIRRVGGKLEETTIRAYTWQILRGLEYLHANGIVHCDIKSSNLLMGKENVKISDFGCSKVLVGDNDLAVFCGTPMYMSPEVVLGQRQGFESDIWSLGCTVVEMATGKKPWPEVSDDPISALHRIGFSGESPELPSWLSQKGKDFLGKCFERNPKERLTAKELLKHRFFEDLVFEKSDDQRTFSPRSVFDDQSVWDSFEASITSTSQDDHHREAIITVSSVVERIQRLIGYNSSDNDQSDWINLDDDEDWITIRRNEMSTTSASGVSFHNEFLSLGVHVNNNNYSDIISTNISDSGSRKRDFAFAIAFDECTVENIVIRNLKLKEGNENFSSLQYFSVSFKFIHFYEFLNFFFKFLPNFTGQINKEKAGQ